MTITKWLLIQLFWIVPFQIKGQSKIIDTCVHIPDSISRIIEQNYRYENTNASKNVVNLMFPQRFKWGNGIYAYKGFGPHFPRLLFICKNNNLFFFKNAGFENPIGVILEFTKSINVLGLSNKESLDYLGVLYEYLKEEQNIDYGGIIK